MKIRRFGLVAALAFTACSPPQPVGTVAPMSAALPPPAVSRDQPGDAAKAGPKPAEAPSLVGLVSGDVEVLFGHPRFVRRDGPAQIWQYGTDACTLNLFLYRDGAAYKVRHFEFRNRSADLASAGGCDGVILSMAQPKTP